MEDGLDGKRVDKQFRVDLGKRIRGQLEQTDTSYAELARRIGVTQTTVTRYVNGDINMTAAMLGRIAAALDCTVSDLAPADEAVA